MNQSSTATLSLGGSDVPNCSRRTCSTKDSKPVRSPSSGVSGAAKTRAGRRQGQDTTTSHYESCGVKWQPQIEFWGMKSTLVFWAHAIF